VSISSTFNGPSLQGTYSPGIDMRFPVSRRYRHLVFAVIMSLVTALIVSGVITASHAGLDDQYFDHWVKGFFMVWPIVFIVILVIAPLVSRFVDAIAEN
jgi:uncharacterized membrane protein YcfT